MHNLTVYESLRALNREANDLATSALREHGLNLNQYLALAAIADHGPLTAYAVATRMWVAEASVGHAIATLRGKGYVIRDEKPDGGGPAKPLLITQAGMVALTAAAKSMRSVDRDMGRYLTDAAAEGVMAAHVKLRGWYDLPL